MTSARVRGDGRGRPGVGLIEVVVSIALAGLIATLATGLFVAQARLSAHAAESVEAMDALRSASALLPLEARALAEVDLHGVAGDSAAFRAFRGVGQVCSASAGGATVRYRGLRDPDPAKDSILIVSVWPERASALASALHAVSQCSVSVGETLFDVRLTGDSLVPLDVVLVFEAGSYHLSTGALRYRAPGGTRQPITADVLGGAGFDLLLRQRAGPVEPIAIDLDLMPASRRPATSSPVPAHRVRVPLLNASAPPDST